MVYGFKACAASINPTPNIVSLYTVTAGQERHQLYQCYRLQYYAVGASKVA